MTITQGCSSSQRAISPKLHAYAHWEKGREFRYQASERQGGAASTFDWASASAKAPQVPSYEIPFPHQVQSGTLHSHRSPSGEHSSPLSRDVLAVFVVHHLHSTPVAPEYFITMKCEYCAASNGFHFLTSCLQLGSSCASR